MVRGICIAGFWLMVEKISILWSLFVAKIVLNSLSKSYKPGLFKKRCKL